jgi:hypothetical protein
MTNTLIKAFKREFAMELFQKYPRIAVDFYEQLMHVYNFLESYIEMCAIDDCDISLRCNFNFARLISSSFKTYSEFSEYFYFCYVYINVDNANTIINSLLDKIGFDLILENLYKLYCSYFKEVK